MRRGGAAANLASSPTMVGAVTVLVAILAVFLAYNANNGLPFVPSYRVSVLVPDAAQLVRGNEVRVGGVRVGVIEDIDPLQKENTGQLYARLDLKLDQTVEPIPRDSTYIIRARSALGLKYLEINRGDSERGWPAGSLLPLSKATPHPVEIDQVLNTFDDPTRLAIQQNLVEFGNALAGRGPDINAAIGSLGRAVPPLQRVMRNLGSPQTRIGRFFDAISATAAEVAPVAGVQADMFAQLDTTFDAFADVSRPFIQETISEGPPTMDVAVEAFPRIRPFLANSAGFFQDLRPGVESLRANAGAIASAFEAGVPALRESPPFNRETAKTALALQRFNDDAGVRAGLDRLVQTSDVLTPTLRFIAPAQTTCNYGSILLRNVASLFSQGDGIGSWQRFEVFYPPIGPNNEGSPSDAPANGGPDPFNLNFLHSNPYPNTASPGQPHECEAGNEGYIQGQQVIGNVPGNQGIVTRETDCRNGLDEDNDGLKDGADPDCAGQ